MSTPTNNYTTAPRLQLLIDITRDLDLNLDELLSQILDRLQSVIPIVDIGAIYLYDHQIQALIPRSCLGYDMNSMRNIRLAEGESISGQVFTDHKPILTANPEQVLATAGSLSAHNHRLYQQATGGRSIERQYLRPPDPPRSVAAGHDYTKFDSLALQRR